MNQPIPVKYLYETTIQKQVEEDIFEKRQENGQEVEVKKKVKSLKPVKLALIKPGRRTMENAETFYALKIAEFIRAGLLPYSLVAKRYANDGGPLSDPEIKKLDSLKDESLKLREKYASLAPLNDDKNIEEKKNVLLRLNDINHEISLIQDAYADIFENTAEVKARNRIIDWWTLNLAVIDEDGKGYKPLFGSGTFDEKVDKYDEYENQDDPFYIDSIRLSGYLVAFWFSSRNTINKGDFESMEKIYRSTLSKYHPEDIDAPEEKPTEETKTE